MLYFHVLSNISRNSSPLTIQTIQVGKIPDISKNRISLMIARVSPNIQNVHQGELPVPDSPARLQNRSTCN